MTVWPARRTLVRDPAERSGLRDAIASLRRLVERETVAGAAPLRRIEIEIAEADPLAFLAAQRPGGRSYFRTRDGVLAIAGVGVAASFPTLDAPGLRDIRAAEPRLIAMLTGRFDPNRELAREWSTLGLAAVLVPVVELRRDAERTTLAAHLVGDGAQAREVLARLEGVEQPTDRHALLPEFAPGFGADKGIDSSLSAWKTAVDATLRDIAAKSVRKVVLARTRTFRLAELADPCELLLRLSANEPGTYQFVIEDDAGVAFVGASPERLFHRDGVRLQSEALAGTRPRAETPDRDRSLAEGLFRSEKDRHEHQLVLDQIRERLEPLTETLRCARHPRLMQLANVQHLCSPVSATLRADVTDAELLAALHPTPAVCGQPVERARTIIRACEPFDRGLYAGPIGAIGATSEVCVAIRSALVAGPSVTAFAGAGVVTGSSAESEWRETEHKLATFERLVRPA
ncbi:MAG: isochorismate synthase [Phycisphaerales bacterium]